MRETFAFGEAGLRFVLTVDDMGDVLLHQASSPLPAEPDQHAWYRLVEVQVSGENQDDHHDVKHTGTLPGKRLCYQQHQIIVTPQGPQLQVQLHDPLTHLVVTVYWQAFTDLPIIRAWTTLTNTGEEPLGIEYVTSFALTGLVGAIPHAWDRDLQLHVPHNTWMGEAQWRTYTLPELGLMPIGTFGFSVKRIDISNLGTWSTAQHLPMGILENTVTHEHLFWQIEHHGSWQWEISDVAGVLYLQLSGPTEQEHHWWHQLAPGASFTSVPVAVGSVSGTFDDAVGVLTRYRRRIRRPHPDNERLPVIFNDYMNCLEGDPTTAKLLPLIAAAAQVGCEYFCIDAGWYADDGTWWDAVGAWQPSATRFPGGIDEVLAAIRARNMIPGLWLEIEVMGIKSPSAIAAPDTWFFCRHGKRVSDHGRYQLDFRHPDVSAYADTVIRRLVEEYGIGYLKMDYNNNFGMGTEIAAESFGVGLLAHQRAYLAWLERTMERYPHLVIENCSSGGMRMDYALLSRHPLQSVSDQTDYRRMAIIAAASPTAVTPEQAAIWSYPLRDATQEAVIMNMVNTLLLRVHQSGHLTELSPEGQTLVQEAIACYKTFRHEIPQSIPSWPLGVPTFASDWTCLCLTTGNTTYLAVWRLASSNDQCVLPLIHVHEREVVVTCLYPTRAACHWEWQASSTSLTIMLPQPYSARLFQITAAQ